MQQPQQEGGIELGIEHQFVGSQNVHHATPALGLKEVERLLKTLCRRWW